VKYFTKQLWIDAQQPGDTLEAERRYEEGFAAYAQDLAALRPRLPADVFAFFERADVHDGKLVQLRVRDFDPLAPKPVPTAEWADAGGENDESPREGPYRLGVVLTVAEWTRTVWTLRYAGIRRILVDCPTESPLFHDPGDGFEDWGYHELSDAGDGFLRHEVIFSSGAVLLVEFRDVSVERVDPALPQAAT
jgi:hypothetical protein